MRNPLSKAVVKPKRTVGVSGYVVYAGKLQSPEKHSDLTGSKRYETFSNMLANVGIVGAGVRYFLNLIAGATWEMKPADVTPEAQEYADRLKNILHDMDTTWESITRKTASFKFHGFSLQEWTAKKRADGWIGFEDIEARPQSTIDQWTRKDRKINGVVQLDPETFEKLPIPLAKMIYAVDDALNDSPEGLGLFRHIAEAVRVLQRYEQLEGMGYENDLEGMPYAYAPLGELQEEIDDPDSEMTKEKMDTMLEVPKAFIRGHRKGTERGILLESEPFSSGAGETESLSSTRKWEVGALKSESKNLEAMAGAIDRKIWEIAVVLGVEHFLLGYGAKGAYNLSKDKSNKLFLLVVGTLKELAKIYERQLRDVIWRLNGWPEEMKPGMIPKAIRMEDIADVTAALRDLAISAGQLQPDDPITNQVLEIMGLSQPDSGFAGAHDASLTGKPEGDDMPEEDEE